MASAEEAAPPPASEAAPAQAAGAKPAPPILPAEDESLLPRSTSSAMPDPDSPNVPRLRARVHQRLSAADCARIPLGALRFRPLRAEDYEEMVALHTEWFPVSYDEAFYTKSVQGEIFTLVATHSGAPREAAQGQGPQGCEEGGSASSSGAQEDLLGMITMSTACEHHCDDITTVLGADCGTVCSRRIARLPDGRLLSEDGCGGTAGPSGGGSLAYILTLGVAESFRRRGLARELLRHAVLHVGRSLPEVQAVYLHVVTYNAAAIRLYESMRFLRVSQFQSFYYLHGQPYDSFLYALYVNGGRPPWKWRLRNLLGLGLTNTWREWVICAWSSLWRGELSGVQGPLEAEVP